MRQRYELNSNTERQQRNASHLFLNLQVTLQRKWGTNGRTQRTLQLFKAAEKKKIKAIKVKQEPESTRNSGEEKRHAASPANVLEETFSVFAAVSLQCWVPNLGPGSH